MADPAPIAVDADGKVRVLFEIVGHSNSNFGVSRWRCCVCGAFGAWEASDAALTASAGEHGKIHAFGGN